MPLPVRPTAADDSGPVAGSAALWLLDAYDEVTAALSDASNRVEQSSVSHPDAPMRDAADAAKQR